MMANKTPKIWVDHIGGKVYPAWRYHEFFEPRIVKNKEEDEQAAREGWKSPEVPITAVPELRNWYHDLEDMNAKQLCIFAREEYGVELPEDANEEKLLKAIWNIAKIAPQNKDRMILLAQSVVMNYDETIEEIKKAAENFEETEGKEIWV